MNDNMYSNEVQEWIAKEWHDYYEKTGRYKIIDRLLSHLSIEELDDVIEYLAITLRKKEMRGDFDYLKNLKKKTES